MISRRNQGFFEMFFKFFYPGSLGSGLVRAFRNFRQSCRTFGADAINDAKPGATRDYVATLEFRSMTMSRIGSHPPVDHQKTGELFVSYCGSCHLGPESPAPPLPLEDQAAMASYRGFANRNVR